MFGACAHCPVPNSKAKFFGPTGFLVDEPRFGDGAGPGVEPLIGGAQNVVGRYFAPLLNAVVREVPP